MNNQEIVVLFSGGTDSTLTAALVAQKYHKVHLVTYDRAGFANITNPKINVQKLKDKYGADKFDFEIININKLSKLVFYERYLRNCFRHGFFLLSNCGLCKLAMHIRTVIYCLDHKITQVCDGANQGMHLFPAQMAGVIAELKAMYGNFGIDYSNPVFDYAGPQDTGFVDRLHFDKLLPENEGEQRDEGNQEKPKTAGCALFELGLMPSENVKGTELDRSMQPRCFQFILFNIFVMWYYLYDHSYEEYQAATLKFYKDKIKYFTRMLEEYAGQGPNSKLSKFL